MIERTQPVVEGVNKSGELVWGIVAMPRWQMEMFRVKYYGDFMAHWIKKQFCDNTGHEADPAMASMELRTRKWNTSAHPIHDGD